MYYNAKGEPCGLIYNIQGYTIHDGPGIRTELFFKGCPLKCPWCSNPEGMDFGPQLGIYPSKCLGKSKCSYCVKDCPMAESPIKFDENGIIASANMAEACRDCLRCADACPAEALIVWGKKMTVPEIMKILESDRSFYERTGGGVTVSGGEVLMQWDFVTLLLKACREAGIHTCVESALHVPTEHLDAVLDYTDILITDIKYIDSERHKAVTGLGNELILRNIRHVAERGIPIVIRTPVVPGWNDDDENMMGIGGFIRDNLGSSVIQYQLLPYRKMGTEKYATLNRPYPMGDYEAPERDVWEVNLLAIRDKLVETYGIPAVAGSGEKLPGYDKN